MNHNIVPQGDATVDSIFKDVNRFQNDLRCGQIERARSHHEDRRKLVRSVGLLMLGAVMTAGVTIGMLEITEGAGVRTDSSEVPVSTVFDPEQCDFSAAAETNPSIRGQEYQQCKADARMGLPGFTSGN